MGACFSLDHSLSDHPKCPKAIMLLSYEKGSLVPISFLDFVCSPVSYAPNPLILIEPIASKATDLKINEKQSYIFSDTMRVIHQHFKIEQYKYSYQTLWMLLSTRIPSGLVQEAISYLKTVPFQNYCSHSAIDVSNVFLDIRNYTTLASALSPQKSGITSSSPLRQVAQINCGNVLSRRSHVVAPTINTFIKPKNSNTQDSAALLSKCDPMNLIIPHVYIGGERAAKDKDGLINANITHIINLSGNITQSYYTETFLYYTVKMNDTDFEELDDRFWGALEFLKKAVADNGNVLVHCRRGISRSAALCIAYISDTQSLSVDLAYDIVKSSRPIVNVNPGFLEQLKSREEKPKKSKPRMLKTVSEIY